MSMMYSKYLDFVEKSFENCFSNKQYVFEPPVTITSRIDPSMTFIGSAISTMKKYVLNRSVGENGRFIIQNSIRTQALKKILTSEYSMFGSYFKALGALVEYHNLERLVIDTFDYLIEYLKIPYEDIVIRINSKDKDLIDSIKSIDKRIIREYDTLNALNV